MKFKPGDIVVNNICDNFRLKVLTDFKQELVYNSENLHNYPIGMIDSWDIYANYKFYTNTDIERIKKLNDIL